jgi:hypothetical protein
LLDPGDRDLEDIAVAVIIAQMAMLDGILVDALGDLDVKRAVAGDF